MPEEDTINAMAEELYDREFGNKRGDWKRLVDAADCAGEHSFSWSKRNRVMSTARALHRIAHGHTGSFY